MRLFLLIINSPYRNFIQIVFVKCQIVIVLFPVVWWRCFICFFPSHRPFLHPPVTHCPLPFFHLSLTLHLSFPASSSPTSPSPTPSPKPQAGRPRWGSYMTCFISIRILGCWYICPAQKAERWARHDCLHCMTRLQFMQIASHVLA